MTAELVGAAVTPVSRRAGSFPEVLSEDQEATVSNSCAGRSSRTQGKNVKLHCESS